jgi:hypothetical protein
MSKDKILLLDVDGVICPMGRPPEHEELLTIKAGWNRGYIRKDVASWLEAVARDYNIRWFTSWLGEANGINVMLKISSFPVVDVNAFNFNSELWQKWGAIKQFCKENRDVGIVVVDDDVPEDEKIREFNEEKPSNLRLFKPKDPMVGLSGAEMKQISKMMKCENGGA